MKFPWLFIISLSFWLAIAFSGSAKSADEMGYKLVGLNQSVKEAMKTDASWRKCGDYFAAGESTEGKIVHFTFERGTPENVKRTFTFITVDHFIVSIEKKVAAPVVIVLGYGEKTEFVLRMNVEDYKAGLPCLAKGEKV